MNDKFSYSIVIPCLNEEQSLPYVFSRIKDGMSNIREPGEIILVDNGSTDRSCEIAREAGARVVVSAEKGYGNALFTGISSAQSENVIFADADGSYDFTYLPLFYEALARGKQFVIGSRLRGKIEKGAMPFLHRYLGTPVLSFLINLFFRIPISDCNCGMRGIKKSAFEKMKLVSTGMEFASEMVIKAALLRTSLMEIPIDFYKDKRGRKPHLHTWRDGWRHLRFILVFAPNYLFVFPGAILFTLGSILVFLQSRGPILVWNIYMDLHFMVFGLILSIIGLSIFLMGVTIKQFSAQYVYYRTDLSVKSFSKVTFEKKLVIGGICLIIGASLALTVIFQWVRENFANPQMLRLTLFSFYFLALGTFISLFSLLEVVMKTNKREIS